jgi:predicted AlkP superfamily pyrophosphatase or phosphodiesterase
MGTRISWWYVIPLAMTGLGLNVAALSLSPGVKAQPPPLVTTDPQVPAPEAAKEPASAGKPRVKHVLIISEDGLRPDALSRLHLHWHELLKKRGSYTFRAVTTRDASTLPAHASMLSGVHPHVHGLTWNTWKPSKGYIKTPTVFSRANDAGLTTAFFTGKSKLRHIVPPGTVGVYDRPGYYCKKVAEEAARYLAEEKPALAFVHFSDPDELGHSKGWMSRAQLRAIEDTDKCLGVLYESLEEADLLDSTLIILTADHGGHNRVHSGAKRIDREIPWIACGPGVRENNELTAEVSTVDTAATVLYALGLEIPADLAGKPRTEIFQE